MPKTGESTSGESVPTPFAHGLPAPPSARHRLPIDRIHDLDIENKKKLHRTIRRRPKVRFDLADSTDEAFNTPPLNSLNVLPDDSNPPIVSPALTQPTLSGAVAGGIFDDSIPIMGGTNGIPTAQDIPVRMPAYNGIPTAQDIPVRMPAYNLRPRRSLNASWPLVYSFSVRFPSFIVIKHMLWNLTDLTLLICLPLNL
jgi:hypothetical protein